MHQPGSDLKYQIALTLPKGIGPTLAKRLIAHFGSAQAVFKAPKKDLEEVERLSQIAIADLQNSQHLLRAEEELKFIEKQGLQAHFYLSPAYPRRLKHCEDGPLVLYQKGHCNLNASNVIAIVGTRGATDYGKSFCHQLGHDLIPHQPLVVSGMAYGIDAAAHKAALEHKLPTIGVMAHGLDSVYPHLHRKLAEDILASKGALVSEFISGTKPDRENFPKRNRIIAGMSDATLVIEAANKGGALITADLANGYNRDVFALPGRHNDKFSEGCNKLIRGHKANLLTGVKDLEYILGWQANKGLPIQPEIFANLSPAEQRVYDFLESKNKGVELYYISTHFKEPVNRTLQALMTLELKGLVKCLPGKIYAKA
jgi:DNA processing protein